MYAKLLKLKMIIATGFLCKIPHPDQFSLLPVLITNNHILEQEDIKINKSINITLNDDKTEKIINIVDSRLTFTSKNLDITIIEIKPFDGINNFLDIDENIFEDNYNEYYKDKSVYI